MSGFLERLWQQADSGMGSTVVVVATTAMATAAILPLLKHFLWRTHPKIIPSPLKTVLPRLSPQEIDQLEYKTDAFPGARDVATPVSPVSVSPLSFTHTTTNTL